MKQENNIFNQNNEFENLQSVNTTQTYIQPNNNPTNQNISVMTNSFSQNNMQPQTIESSQFNQAFSKQTIDSINSIGNNTQQFNNKPKKKINLGLIIGVILIAIIIILGILLIPKLFNSGENNANSKSSNLVSYINESKTDANKLALLLRSGSDIEYVLTINNDQKIELSNDYLYDLYKDSLKVKIKDDYEFELVINNLYIIIEDEEIDDDDIIIRQSGNWYLVKGNDEYTKIYLKIDNSNYSWEEDWISFIISNNNNEDLNEKYFETIIKNFNIYVVNNDSDKLSFTDFNNNDVNLSTYTFINDSIVSSLTKYGIYLKKTTGVEEVDSSIIYDSNNELYFIDLINDKKMK